MLSVISDLEGRLAALRTALYRDLRTAELTGESFHLLLCKVGEVALALPLASVETVVLACETRPVPQAPDWLVGILDRGGTGIPIIDVYARLFARHRPPALADMFVLWRKEARVAGLLVHEVLRVVESVSTSVQEAVHDIPHAPYLTGFVRLGDEMVGILSVEQLCSVADLPENGS
jgi:purine-binding chemotaxis protein CheW